MSESIDVEGYRIDLDGLYRAMYDQSVIEADGTRVFHGNSPEVRAMKRLLNDLFNVPVRDTFHPTNHAARQAATEALASLGWATKGKERTGRYEMHRTPLTRRTSLAWPSSGSRPGERSRRPQFKVDGTNR